MPAYDQCIKASHLFNLLDARGVISVTERAAYIGRVRTPGEGLLRGMAGRRRAHRRQTGLTERGPAPGPRLSRPGRG